MNMKRISIRDLHLHTGQYVRQAAEEGLIVTDRGRTVAILAPVGQEAGGAPLPDRESLIRRLPRLRVDSTALISEERQRS